MKTGMDDSSPERTVLNVRNETLAFYYTWILSFENRFFK